MNNKWGDFERNLGVSRLIDNLWNGVELSRLNRAINWNMGYLNQDEIKYYQNILSFIEWEKFHSYSSDKLELTEDRKRILESIEDNKDWIKKLVESLIRKSFKDIIDSLGIDWKAYLTSDADDVFSWIDLILNIDGVGDFWIDVAVSSNPKYLEEKANKRKITTPVEYNLKNWYPAGRKISRNVIWFPPEVVNEFIGFVLPIIWKNAWLFRWEALECLRKAYKKVNSTLEINNIMQSITNNTLQTTDVQ